MFRSKKKKIHAGSRRVVRTTFDEDGENDVNQVGTNGVGADDKQRLDIDEDEPPSALLIALQQRKAEKRNKKRARAKRKIGSTGGPVVRSFDIEEADENNDDDDQSARKKKKKKRKKEHGFGGGDKIIDFDEDARKDDEMKSSTYGKEALEQLKSEQKRQTVPREPLQSTTSSNKKSMNSEPQILNSYENPPEESFIPLDDLGAEHKTSFENHGRKKEQEKGNIFVVDDPEESHGWEQQIEQRAGLKPSSQSSQVLNNSKLLSLDELSEKLKSTVETINRQREELENSTNRLRADREHALTNSKDHQERLERTGRACEFYQSTRRDLTLWVGALRDLHEKVQPIATAFSEMLQIQTKNFGQEFRAWQDDCVATLYQTNRLDRVLGRQPESTLLTTASNETVIDEFGRDVGSQYLRDRELRFKERVEYMHRNKQYTDVDVPSNDDIIKLEDHDEEDRSKILKQALSAALEDLDKEYTSAARLKAVFDGWFAAYFDDYQQCFATLSFGDLYAVLVEVELYKSNFFPDVLMSVNDRTGASGTGNIRASQRSILKLDDCILDSSYENDVDESDTKKSKTSKVARENAGRLARASEKGVLPMLVKILNDNENKGEDNDSDSPFYLFFSTTKSFLISKLIKDAAIRPLQQGKLSSSDSGKSLGSNLQQQLQRLISAAIQKSLEEISIPLVNKDLNDDGFFDGDKSLPSEALGCSIRFAQMYQVQILQQALCNIITYWFPLIEFDANSDSNSETGIHCVLNFINDKYLVLLSSMENIGETAAAPPSTAKYFFKRIWEALHTDSRNIIESPSLMLLTMPLRAAARAYQLN